MEEKNEAAGPTAQRIQKPVVSTAPSQPPLAPAYPTARGQLMLWSGLLVASLTIGFDPSQLDHIKAIQNPGAIPWILVALVMYSTYRLIVEWLNSPLAAQIRGWARLDLCVTLGVAFFGLCLFIFDDMVSAQKGTQPNILASVGFGFCIFPALAYGAHLHRTRAESNLFFLIAILALFYLMLVAVLLIYGRSFWGFGIGAAGGLALAVFAHFLLIPYSEDSE